MQRHITACHSVGRHFKCCPLASLIPISTNLQPSAVLVPAHSRLNSAQNSQEPVCFPQLEVVREPRNYVFVYVSTFPGPSRSHQQQTMFVFSCCSLVFRLFTGIQTPQTASNLIPRTLMWTAFLCIFTN